VQGETGPEGKEGKQGPEGKEGKQGPEGKEGKQGAEGKEGIVWTGSWSATTVYKLKQAVYYEGSSYIAIKESPENKGKVPASEAAYWELLAREGTKGAEGKEGKQGPEGKEGKEGKQGLEGKEGKEGPGFKVGEWKGREARTAGTQYEPSATEPVQVLLTIQSKAAGAAAETMTVKITVGTTLIAEEPVTAAALQKQSAAISFIVPAKEKWRVETAGLASESINSSYLPLG
jgi:hypothetical protein